VDYFQEITIISSAEIPISFLWSKIYMQLHLCFVANKDNSEKIPYGLSFPEYGKQGLGRKIRIFGETQESLQQLNIAQGLHRLQDYVALTAIRMVPKHRAKTFAIYSRFHKENNPQQKAKRYANRHHVSYDEAIKLFKEPANIDYPYVQMRSLTNQHKFSLFITRTIAEKELYKGFSIYGLSSESTVPEF
jgi:CRISPR-associated endonuclease Csy4